ncbi:hypothetical protein ASPCADRAFT_507813 [Aspergillus carbonarius ITEM 5010]|uniref:Enoyl reductase (ER) domain-containing protein n=1 Tax=Aspergillus carbonarius (strain ITEM 5010) TaxID=602072 RepID=A0A1R3RKF3_ASPC5|nr:hypothetical protein ASPCADRAFT_507813 [Aspergillus carbonarius ITEM 5010]
MATETNTALVVRVAKGQPPRLSKQDIPRPSPAANQVLVKVSHVALNPTDAKGDVVAGLVWGGEVKGLGAYSQYCLADERISFKIPVSVSRAHASTVPLAAATAWLALFSKDCLALDRTQAKGTSVLVWGGSSSVGLYTIQLASICGFDVVTTCSPKHFDLARSYGAKHVFDYKEPDVAKEIREVAPSLIHVFDTIGNKNSSATASHTLRPGAGTLCTVRPGKANTENVATGTRVADVLVWTALLKDHRYGEFKWPASEDDHELASELFENLPTWLEESIIKPNNPKVLPGLDAVAGGFQEHRDGKISAYKIVYEL